MKRSRKLFRKMMDRKRIKEKMEYITEMNEMAHERQNNLKERLERIDKESLRLQNKFKNLIKGKKGDE